VSFFSRCRARKLVSGPLCLVALLLASGCATSRDVTGLQAHGIARGQVISLAGPAHLVVNPGIDQVMPVAGRKLLPQQAENSVGILPEGTRVKYLGAYAESSFMADTRTRQYGRLVDGAFGRRKVALDSLMGSLGAFNVSHGPETGE